jgi:hypothetical protein
MATIFSVQTPKEGWGLVSHYLGNYLLVTQWHGDKTDTGRDNIKELGAEKCERIVFDNHTKLIGAMHMIVRNLNKHGHAEEASKVQQILDMIIEQDVTNPVVAKAIHAKHEELDSGKGEFRAALEQMRAEREGQEA